MLKQELFQKLQHGLTLIHDDIFQEIEINEVLNRDDQYLNMALDLYVQYFDYCDNKEQYNLKYCFKTTLSDLNTFYTYQEKKLEEINNNEKLCDLEHKVNTHIYDEVIQCQKKVNRIYLFNMFTSYFLAFILIFGITEVTHFIELSTLLGSTILALVMAFVKIFIDKRYLEVLRNKVGWKSYRYAIKRSLAFYLASVIILNQCKHNKHQDLDDETLRDYKNKIHESIDVILSEMIFKES